MRPTRRWISGVLARRNQRSLGPGLPRAMSAHQELQRRLERAAATIEPCQSATQRSRLAS